jgi:hypothetical protein
MVQRTNQADAMHGALGGPFMPALNAEDWARLRAEWEIGLTSTRALATRHGVSEKAIRKRAADGRDPWRRDVEAERRARAAGHEATLQGIARSRSAREVRADRHALNELRDAAVSDAADAIAAANLRHLAMGAELRAMFEALCKSVTHALERSADAHGCRGLVGRGGIARSLLALARLALASQQIERTALGMGDGSGVTLPPSDPAGRAEVDLPYRIEDLSTEELSALARLAALADQARDSGIFSPAVGSDGLPVPPSAPDDR